MALIRIYRYHGSRYHKPVTYYTVEAFTFDGWVTLPGRHWRGVAYDYEKFTTEREAQKYIDRLSLCARRPIVQLRTKNSR